MDKFVLKQALPGINHIRVSIKAPHSTIQTHSLVERCGAEGRADANRNGVPTSALTPTLMVLCNDEIPNGLTRAFVF
ncbi:hypothetical protein GT347_14900 [Xylophilus rhododendri]|uniref:Uncharacterized protein n=1 Tax=Xylophilus rhododendri TaxID=2697032 RepID=A0A857J5A2_9BURK|nr:hypothetical protein [Xylophilus rhododendri]QHI99150.1 hypothetical protein GT347_14900 [Xylophilus rhododendri]